MRTAPEPRARGAPAAEARDRDAERPAPASPAGEARELVWDSVSAWFGSCKRSGDWTVPDEIRVGAYFGQVKLDLTEALLPPGRTVEVDALTVFGQLKLIVPGGTGVDVDGARAIFGQIKHASPGSRVRSVVRRWVGSGPPDDDLAAEEPLLLRVSGTAIFGAVIVSNR